MELNNNSTKLDRKNDDLISRQAALDDAHRQIWYRMNQQGMRDRIDEWLKNLPSAEPERKKGKWIYDSESYPLGNPAGHYNCDQCGESVSCKSNFCPNCGAKMEGE